MTTFRSRHLRVLGLVAILVTTALLAAAAAASVPASTNSPRGMPTAGPFDGQWHASLSRAQLIRAGAAPALADALYGPYRARFTRGRFTFRNGRTHSIARGSFVVRRQVARFRFSSGVGVRAGQVTELTWSLFRGRLTFKAIRGRPSLFIDLTIWMHKT